MRDDLWARIGELRAREQARLAETYKLPCNLIGCRIHNAYLDALDDVERELAALDPPVPSREPEPINTQLLTACRSFVRSFASGQREKCDVAMRLAKAAIANAESVAPPLELDR